MSEEKTQGQKQAAEQKPKSAQPGQTQQPAVKAQSPTATTAASKKSTGKDSRPKVGGSAVQGAKSTQPRPATASNDPNQQQMDSYNRTMRRRMEQMGGQTQEDRMQDMQKQRQKRVTRKKQKLEEKRQDIRKSMPAGGKITLGRRNLYFLLATIGVIVLFIVIFIILRLTHVIG
jgi:hypothetical protein